MWVVWVTLTQYLKEDQFPVTITVPCPGWLRTHTVINVCRSHCFLISTIIHNAVQADGNAISAMHIWWSIYSCWNMSVGLNTPWFDLTPSIEPPVVMIKKTCFAYFHRRWHSESGVEAPEACTLRLTVAVPPFCTLTHSVYLLNNRIPSPLCPILKERSPKAQRCTVFALIHSENTIILPPLGCEIAVQPLLNTLQS